MRSNRRTARRGRSDGSFWLSFSDLMSSLVLIVILVMFYIIYQYFNLAEINQAEIARREYQLEVAQTELESQQTKLTDAEKQMIAQQILLDAKEKELTDAQSILEAQKTELASTQSQLSEKELEIASQQAQLISQQLLLDDQQAQLLVQQAQLATQQEELASTQVQLSEKESEIASQQAQLLVQQDQLALQQSQLTQQQDQLVFQQDQLAQQQSQISTQQAQLDSQQAQIEQLVGMRARIITSLSSALRQSGISATVDPTNGSIALESDVLFEVGQYRLSSRGKKFIDSFLPVYLNVLFSDEYRPYLAEIIVEGHTDSDGGYLSNLELSQQRALAVASYVLGNSCRTVTEAVKEELRPVVTVNGRSYSDRIFDAFGNEDKDASRRVVFKFRMTDEQMIQQMRQILESH